MGRPGTTRPFAPEELARLAEVTSSNFEPRPTTKLSRDEILGLVSQTVSPDAVATHRVEPPATVEIQAQEPPAPEEPQVAESPPEEPAPAPAWPAAPARPVGTGLRVVLLVGALALIVATVTAFAW